MLEENKINHLTNLSEYNKEIMLFQNYDADNVSEAKAKAKYYINILRNERKRQKLSQRYLGKRIGKKREYISALERGQADMKLSTFLLIANALGMHFSLVEEK